MILLTSKFPQVYEFSFEHLLFLYQVHTANHKPAMTRICEIYWKEQSLLKRQTQITKL